MMLVRLRDVVLSVDNNGLLWATRFRHPVLNRGMEILSRAGDWDAWTLAIAGSLAIPGRSRRIGRAVLPRITAAVAICYALKRVARRSRPSVRVEGFSTLLSDPDPYSFPSSHSACSWAATVAAARVVGGIGWFLIIHAVLVSYSRIHVGAHYPLDVLIGSVIGTTIGLL